MTRVLRFDVAIVPVTLLCVLFLAAPVVLTQYVVKNTKP